jgi:hypothetical protein
MTPDGSIDTRPKRTHLMAARWLALSCDESVTRPGDGSVLAGIQGLAQGSTSSCPEPLGGCLPAKRFCKNERTL